jgi:membrane protease YdiL (CAAX protease family)
LPLPKSKIIDQKSSIALFAVMAPAVALFVPLFLTGGIGPFDFWWWMTVNLVVLLTLVQFVDASWRHALVADFRDYPARKVAVGVLSALVLYGVFWLGNKLSCFLFPGAAQNIAAVYGYKGQASGLRIALLMLLIIGPGEELFWRGFLQRHLANRLDGRRGWLWATAIYTAIHVVSGNPMLVVAAGVCGLFWGWLYWKRGSLLLNIVSHTIWDIGVFLLFPFH